MVAPSGINFDTVKLFASNRKHGVDTLGSVKNYAQNSLQSLKM